MRPRVARSPDAAARARRDDPAGFPVDRSPLLRRSNRAENRPLTSCRLAALLACRFARRLLRLGDLFAAVTFQLRRNVVVDPLLVPPLDREDGNAVQVDAVVEVIAGGESRFA